MNKLEYNCKEFDNPNYLVVSKITDTITNSDMDPSIIKELENSLRDYHNCGLRIKVPQLFNELKATKPELKIR